jgi:hypothetical protein
MALTAMNRTKATIRKLIPVIEGRRRRLARLRKRIVVGPFQWNEHVGKIDAPREHAERRHDDVIDQRLDDGGERGTDDNTHRHGHYIATQREFLELFRNRRRLIVNPRLGQIRPQRSLPCHVSPPTGPAAITFGAPPAHHGL